MTGRLLLTGARTVIALELARAFHRGGHRVLVAETFPDYTARFSNCVDGAFAVPAPRLEPDAFIGTLASLIREHGITHLLPTGEESLYVARGRARLDPLCRVLCDDVEQLDALHDKLRFQELAAAIGPTLRTWRVEDAAHAAALQRDHGPLIFKRIYSRFGQSVATSASEVTGSGWLAQKWAEGRELCGFAIARDGHVVSHVVYLPRYRLPRGPAFYFEPLVHARAEGWMRELVARCRYSGPIAFDFIESADGTLYPLECNPRVTSGVHLMGGGEVVRAFIGESAPHPLPLSPRGGERGPYAAMWGAAMVGIALPRVPTARQVGEWSRAFAAARDVVWDSSDRRPALHTLATLKHLRELRRRHHISLTEAATFYTEWSGMP